MFDTGARVLLARSPQPDLCGLEGRVIHRDEENDCYEVELSSGIHVVTARANLSPASWSLVRIWGLMPPMDLNGVEVQTREVKPTYTRITVRLVGCSSVDNFVTDQRVFEYQLHGLSFESSTGG